MGRTGGQHRFTAILAAAAMLVCGLAGTSPTEAQTEKTLYVAAASDLRFALQEIATLFEPRSDARIRLTFGSSGLLTSQIEQGAPFDVFFSADETFVAALARKGLILKDTVQLYAIGRVVLWTRSDSPVDLSDGLGALLDERIRFVAIANPKHAPYGRAAEQTLRSIGLYARVQPKLVLGENINQTLQLVQTGNADVGVVAFSLAIAPAIKATGRYFLIPQYLHRPIRQAAGVVSRSPHPEVARSLLAFINGSTGRTIMRRYGFTLPGESL